MFKKILLATSLISLFALTDSISSRDTFLDDNRVSMYYLWKMGLPKDFHTREWDNVGFSKKQKEVLKNICLNGKYNPSNGDSKYVSPIWADELLETYGWN